MMECRPGCGACCIAPSISSSISGMPGGEPAGVHCIQLTTDHLCRIFGMTERPAVCSGLRPDAEMCGRSSAEAMTCLAEIELRTRPVRGL
jgi:hypothetical protein